MIYLEIILKIVTVLSLAIGSYVALQGLGEWKKKLKTNSKYEISKKLLKQTFKVQHAIQLVRSPLMNLEKKDEEEDSIIKAEQREYDRRISKLNDEWSTLHTLILEAEVEFGRDVQDVFEDLIKCRALIISNVWLHFWLKGAYAPPGATVDDSPGRVRENERIIYKVSEDPDEDEFTAKIQNAVDKIENYLRPKLEI